MINFRYDIIVKVGSGGDSEIYLVKDALMDRRVAMKLLSRSSSERLDETIIRKEFSVLSNLCHPNLVSVFDFGIVRRSDAQELIGRHYYTMEYLEGKDVLQHVSGLPAGKEQVEFLEDRKSTRLNSSHIQKSRMPSSA